MTSRRSFLIGVGAALAAPAIVKAESLMKVAKLRETAALGDIIWDPHGEVQGAIFDGTHWRQIEYTAFMRQAVDNIYLSSQPLDANAIYPRLHKPKLLSGSFRQV